MEIWLNIITEIGFPIACVLGLAYFVWTIYQQSVKREEALMHELTENRAINQQALETLAIYNSRLEVIEGDIKEIKEHVI
jgi:hypothetical protein